MVPRLTTMFNSQKKDDHFSADMLQASIMMLLKPEKDTQSWGNFCPIYLINIDMKLLTKVLASCLNQILHNLVSKDQTGLVPVWQVTEIIRHTFLLTHR